MPTLIQPQNMPIQKEGEGWRLVTLADKRVIGNPAMTARRWIIDPGATGPSFTHGKQEQLLYVIRGSGSALVNGAEFSLSLETVLWLETGDVCRFTASEEGLEILQGYAPGD
jgi:quercetin dioxygenase-like cupin family protein